MNETRQIYSEKSNSGLVAYLPEINKFLSKKFFGNLISKVLIKILKREEPFLLLRADTDLGKSALIIIPFTMNEIKGWTDSRLNEEIQKVIKLAITNNIKILSFAGLLPSQLNYLTAFPLQKNIILTTGHTTTSLAVALTFQKVFKNISCKNLCVIGSGSIGKSSLILLLEKVFINSSIKKITLCDLQSRSIYLQKLAKDIKKKYCITVECVFYDSINFDQIYTNDVFLGASSTESIVDANKLLPGSILIDDSFPPVLSIISAKKRMQTKKDILVIGGGRIEVGNYKFKFYNSYIVSLILQVVLQMLGKKGFPSCWVEALLLEKSNQYTPSIGLVSPEQSCKYWDLAKKIQLTTPPLHLYSYPISKNLFNKVVAIRNKRYASA